MHDFVNYVLVFILGYLTASLFRVSKEEPPSPDIKDFEIIPPRVKAYDKPSTKRKARIQTDQKAREYELKLEQDNRTIN